jgi:hypothetical protein
LTVACYQSPIPIQKIKATFRSKNRRITLRPGLPQFLLNCFKKYTVAFWGTKSKSYMDDVVPAMLEKVKGMEVVIPTFVWSHKDCEVVH